MSRSNNENQNTNPAKRWFKWSGKDGSIKYWDKEKEENVPVKLPFQFLLLDQLTTITGFNEAEDKGIYSNEVRLTNSEKLNVRCGKNTIEIGLYSDIKDAVKAKGGKFAQSCYIAFKDDNGNLEIGNFLMSGSALSGGEHKIDKKEKIKLDGWMDFFNANKKTIYEGAIKMELEPRVCQKGSNEYRIPKFSLIETSEQTNEIAKALDADLQTYLNEYLKKDNTKPDTEQPQNESSQNNASNNSQPAAEQPANDDFNWDNNNDDDLDLPF